MDRVEYNSGSNRASNFEIALGGFEITSMITPWIVWHEGQLLINRNYNKIREEYDSGLSYLTGLYIQLLSYMPKKRAIQVKLARAWWRVLSNYSGMTRTTVQFRLKSGLLITNQVQDFWYSCDYVINFLSLNESLTFPVTFVFQVENGTFRSCCQHC